LRKGNGLAEVGRRSATRRFDPVSPSWDDLAVVDDCPSVDASHHVVIAVKDQRDYEMAVAVFARAVEFLEKHMADLGA
jgi:hypothetical protein